MSEKLTIPKNVQAFIYKYGGIGSKEQDATFWKEFRKAANAYANVQAKRICDLEHALSKVTEQRDELKNEIIGWSNKWQVAVEMAALAQVERDDMTLRWEVTNDALFDLRDEQRKIEDRLRMELGGHPDSELWGDTGLIAATMRCVDALDEVTEQRDQLAEAVNAATILIAAKGRHHTMLAYEGLRDVLQPLTKPNQ